MRKVYGRIRRDPSDDACVTVRAMGLKPVRTMRLTMNAELARRAGDHLVVSVTSPDRTLIFDLTAWPLTPREVPGLFCPQLEARADGTLLAVARHQHPNPYRPYILDPRTASVTPLDVEPAWREVLGAFALGHDALLVRGGCGDPDAPPCAWWRDGAVTPVALPRPEAPGFVEHGGKKLGMPPRTDTLDAFALPGDEALVISHERLHRVSPREVTPLPPDHLFSLVSPLREGRHVGLDPAGRVLTAVHDRFIAIDREGAITLASPGSDRVRGIAPGPDGMWFLVCDEVVHVVLPDAGAVIELDLREMRMAPTFPLFTPKAVYAPARHALLVVHNRDAWEFDLAAVLREKVIPFAKHAERLAAARRTAWSRKVKAAKTAAIPLDALSMWVRGGGTLIDHPTHGRGVVTHASEMHRAGVMTVSATVLFETRQRTFVCLGDRWTERPWYLG